MRTLVHVTHEAVQKIGGIGAVLQGVFTSRNYNEAFERTILLGPLFTTEGAAEDRLGSAGEVLYSSLDGLDKQNQRAIFRPIEEAFNVDIVYGRRTFVSHSTGVTATPEVLLIDINRIQRDRVNQFKARLWERFRIESNRYENSWEYEYWVKLAVPALDALRAIGAGAAPNDQVVIISHEFMGMPTALAAILANDPRYRTIFWAHEVAPVRKLVEGNSGHDTMFYNVLREAVAEGKDVNDIFGDQYDFFKMALVAASRHCDNVLAVGDAVVTELGFLGPEFAHTDIDLAYNGIPAFHITGQEKAVAKAKLQQYAFNLLGWRPDYVFTHVTRMAVSKGLWRDLAVLEHVEKRLLADGKTAALFVLSSEVAARRPSDIYNLETWYGWPVVHRESLPDLSGGEAVFYQGVQRFNVRGRAIKCIFVNQFGWDRARCGLSMPADMEFMDIRKGSDAEFGQSIYEPFGIAQLEALSFGAICVITNVCGCAGFVQKVTRGQDVRNVIIADYTMLDSQYRDIDELMKIDQIARNRVEQRVSREVAAELLERLPTDERDAADLAESGYKLASQMSWEVVCEDFIIPGVERALRKSRPSHSNIVVEPGTSSVE
jgi:hypothetical protein